MTTSTDTVNPRVSESKGSTIGWLFRPKWWFFLREGNTWILRLPFLKVLHEG
jgi:hypothetical protein